MPIRMLPLTIVGQIRNQFGHPGEAVARALVEKLPLITPNKSTRARRLDVSEFNPRIKAVAVRVPHGKTAADAIIGLRRIVEAHNKQTQSANYILTPPNAYAVGEHLVVMRITNFPLVEEILTHKQTEHTQKFLEMVSKRTKIPAEDIVHYISLGAQSIRGATEINSRHLIFAGMRNRKPIFIPLLSEKKALEPK